MGTIQEALAWSGSGSMLSMFIITQFKEPPPLDMSYEACRPQRVQTYKLEDVGGILGGRQVFEYDAEFPDVPNDLKSHIELCLRNAMSKGAEAAWFGFEGAFSFEFFLAPEIADQVYALADDHGIAIASDTELGSDDWRNRVAAARQRILIGV